MTNHANRRQVLVWGWTLCSKAPFKAWLGLVVIGLLCSISRGQALELALIVHKSNPSQLTQEQLQYVMLNKQIYFSNGQKINVYHQPARSTEHAMLCKTLLSLRPAQYQSYWSRLLFTGNANDLVYLNTAEILHTVAANPAAMSYVPADQVTTEVRVIGILNEQGFQMR